MATLHAQVPSLSPLYFLIPALSIFIILLAAWCATGSPFRRRLAIVIGIASMLPAWLLPSWPYIVRAVCGLVAFTWVMRVVDLSRANLSWSFFRRALHVLSVIDTRRLVRRSSRLEVVGLLQLLGWLLLIIVAVLYLARTRGDDRAFPIDRWLAGDVAVYATVCGLYRLLFVSYSAVGFQTPPLHLSPIFARTVAELWGERWARPISDWLGETFFRPYARRRRPFTGILLAFMVSAGFHAYGIWVGLGFFNGALPAASTFGYFVVQGLIMALERKLKVRAWRPWAGHWWTVFWMLVVSPLFVAPMIRLLGL